MLIVTCLTFLHYFLPTGDILTPCLHGIALAFKGERPKKLKWEDGSHLNVLPVSIEEPSSVEDGAQRDRNFVSAPLYGNLVAALTSPGEWILDACSGSGNCAN